MHALVACLIVAAVSFAAGALYGHSLAALIADDFKKEMAAAIAEIKKIRGEIFHDRLNS